MSTSEIFIILLLFVTVIAILAQALRISYPIALVIGGSLLAFIPSLPTIPLDPEMVFLVFLPPLIMEAAYFTSIHDLQTNLRPIGFLAIILVIITSVGVAWVAVKLIPGMTWSTGFILGAIISPTDPVAITALAKKIHLPRRATAILEGESLINDASALVIYKFAIIATSTGVFSLRATTTHFLWMSISAVILGLLLGFLFLRSLRFVKDPALAITCTFLIPYAVFLCCETIHSSGILAVVTCGIFLGWHAPGKFSPSFRLKAQAVWQMAIFILNGFAFILIGLQLRALYKALNQYTLPDLLFYSSIIIATILALRFFWVFFMAYVVRFIFPALRKQDPYPPWQTVFITGWSGMRGVVSLAAALALPMYLNNQKIFPQRDLIIFITFMVIFFTLVVQGLLLPVIIKMLNFPIDAKVEWNRWHARKSVTHAALNKIAELQLQKYHDAVALKRLREYYEDRLNILGDAPSTPLDNGNNFNASSDQKVRLQVLKAERDKLLEMRRHRQIDEPILQELQGELDLVYAYHEKTL